MQAEKYIGKIVDVLKVIHHKHCTLISKREYTFFLNTLHSVSLICCYAYSAGYIQLQHYLFYLHR